MKKIQMLHFVILLFALSACRSPSNQSDLCEKIGWLEKPQKLWEREVSWGVHGGLAKGNKLAYGFESANREIIAFDYRDGTIAWKYSHGKAYHFSPQFAAPYLLFEFMHDQEGGDEKSSIVGIDAESGEFRFEIPIPRIGPSVAGFGTSFWLRGDLLLNDSVLAYATSDGSIYYTPIFDREKSISSKYSSSVSSGPFKYQEDLFWVLEDGTIVRLVTSEGQFEVMNTLPTGYCRFAQKARDGRILAGSGHGTVVYFDLAANDILWKQNLGAQSVQPLSILEDKAWINLGVEIIGLDLETGTESVRLPFTSVANKITPLKDNHYLLETLGCAVLVDANFSPQRGLGSLSFSGHAVWGDTMVTGGHWVAAYKWH